MLVSILYARYDQMTPYCSTLINTLRKLLHLVKWITKTKKRKEKMV
jgi:hypothetical protein